MNIPTNGAPRLHRNVWLNRQISRLSPWRVPGAGLATIHAEINALYDYLRTNRLPPPTLIYASEALFDKSARLANHLAQPTVATNHFRAN